MRSQERVELYKAAKYQVITYSADHGMNLAEMWKAVNNTTNTFWYHECLKDYRQATEWEDFCRWVDENNGIPADPELPFN